MSLDIASVDKEQYLTITLDGGDLVSTGMRKLRTAYRGLRVHVKEAVKSQVPITPTHWLPN